MMMNRAKLVTALLLAVLSAAKATDEECIKQTTEITGNMVDAYLALQKTVEEELALANAADFCDFLAATCSIDLDQYKAGIEEACPGQLIQKTVTQECTGTIEGFPIPKSAKIVVENIPICVGTACVPGDLPEQLDATFEQVVDQAVAQVEDQLGSIECETAAVDSPSDSPEDTATDAPATTDAPVATPTEAPAPSPASDSGAGTPATMLFAATSTAILSWMLN